MKNKTICAIFALMMGCGSASAGEVWFTDAQGRAHPTNILNISNVADQNGTINVDTLLPGIVPANATSVILTVERGWMAFPTGGTGAVTGRVIPGGYNPFNGDYVDRAKTQEWVIGYMGVDVVAQDVRMPINSQHRDFIWLLQSTHPTEANKMMIIDLWGYVTP